MTAEQILAIPLTAPFRLFSRNASERRNQYLELVKHWHPDKGGKADVFAHISALHAKAETWGDEHTIRIESKNGKHFELKFYKQHAFELGSMTIGLKHVAFFIDSKYDDLTINGVRQIGSIHYPSDKLKKQHQPLIPHIDHVIETKTQMVVIMRKPENTILLRDLIAFMNLDIRHVAWVISRLEEICTFYSTKTVKLCHNGLSVDTVFVNPETHSVYPLGGWWYATKVGADLKFLPKSSVNICPTDILDEKKADHRLDLECIRQIARDLLKYRGNTLIGVPKPFANFIKFPPEKHPIADYREWGNVLTASFGPRRFLKLEVSSNDIYT